ncbi:MAG: MFS transporter [Spirochaetes bacterium]|nr:MFS transporter [Spirochaetota bacterium]MBU0954871.1 MFS transporter [Spirochaetota bacterium]
MSASFEKNLQYYKFCAYGFLKDLRFYEPFLLLFFMEKGLGYLQIGSLYAVREITINLMEIPSGLLADVMGRRRAMLVSFAAYIASFLIFFFAKSYWVLLPAMLAYAVGDAFRTGTHKAMIFDYLKSRGWQHLRTHYYGHTRSWSQRGAALSALIAAALVFYQGSYAPVFLFTIIPYALDFLLILSYPAWLDGPRHGSKRSIRSEFGEVWASLLQTIKHPPALKAIANQALYTGYYKAVKDYLQPLLKVMALSIPVMTALEGDKRTAIITGVMYSLLFLLTSTASSLSGRFSERYKDLAKPLNKTLFTGLLLGLASGIAYALTIPVLAVLLYVGIYVIENLRKPMGIAYISERMRQESMASSLSVESQAETLFAAGLALLLGFFSKLYGPGMGLLLISGLCVLLGVFLRLPAVKTTEPGA